MQVIFFTKFLRGLGVEQLGESAKRLGFDGLDLAVRAGHCINPENARAELPRAVESWRRAGLSVPLVTLETNWTDPEHPGLQAVYAACADAGVPFIKLGYWFWKPDQHYWDAVEQHRMELAALETIGRKLGLCTLVHTHSDAIYGSNASGVMHLVRGLDPRHVAVYLDPAHLAFDGEDLPMALDIVRGYLRMVGVKNAAYERLPQPGSGAALKWKKVMPLLHEGLVDWAQAVQLLRQIGYDGPLAYHGEVDGYMDPERIGKAAAIDLAYLRSILR